MSDGARIDMSDPRVSRVLAWVWTAIGTGVIGATLLAANNLYQLNLTVSNMASNNAIVAAQIKDHEERLRKVERDIGAIEGKVFRGVPGYGEVPHGN